MIGVASKCAQLPQPLLTPHRPLFCVIFLKHYGIVVPIFPDSPSAAEKTLNPQFFMKGSSQPILLPFLGFWPNHYPSPPARVLCPMHPPHVKSSVVPEHHALVPFCLVQGSLLHGMFPLALPSNVKIEYFSELFLVFFFPSSIPFQPQPHRINGFFIQISLAFICPFSPTNLLYVCMCVSVCLRTRGK